LGSDHALLGFAERWCGALVDQAASATEGRDCGTKATMDRQKW
jgi:hypothetical protein